MSGDKRAYTRLVLVFSPNGMSLRHTVIRKLIVSVYFEKLKNEKQLLCLFRSTRTAPVSVIPVPGGYAVIIVNADGTHLEIVGSERHTTNNRMELMAALVALRQFRERTELRIISDSRYLVDGMTKWLDPWKEKGWRKADNSPVENQELWRRPDARNLWHRVEWVWVRSHNGDKFNEIADRIAREAAARAAQGDV